MPTISKMKITLAAATDIGTVRHTNEDFYCYSKPKKFFVLCDGMGGYQKGAIASKMAGEILHDLIFASETLRNIVIENKFFDVRKACEDIDKSLPIQVLKLVSGIRLANRRILAYSMHHNKMKGMGTTIVTSVIHEGHIFIAHVGDSRIYRLRDGQLSCLTRDHSWLNELIEDEEINEEDVKTFKKKNVLTRALGNSPTIKVDLQIEPVNPDDLYLLCSDGLFNALSSDLIQSILTAPHSSLQNKISNLVNSAMLNDGSDNITGGLIHVSGKRLPAKNLEDKFTIDDEPAQVSAYLDQAIKSIYPKTVSSTNSKKILTMLIGVITVVISAGFLFIRSSIKPKIKSSITQSALFTPHRTTKKNTHPSPVSLKKGGNLVLLQLNDEKHLKVLEDIEGINILDNIQKFKNDIPMYAGKFTWVIADSTERILYKKNNIKLLSADEWSDKHSPQDSASTTDATLSLSNLKVNLTKNNQGLVYLLGNFDFSTYDEVSIFINGKLLGSLKQYKESGFYLSRGVYNIEIRSRANQTLKKKSNIKINNGETIAIEF